MLDVESGGTQGIHVEYTCLIKGKEHIKEWNIFLLVGLQLISVDAFPTA